MADLDSDPILAAIEEAVSEAEKLAVELSAIKETPKPLDPLEEKPS